MYPFIDVFGYPIYIFGLALLVCFFVFFYMLKKLTSKYGFDMAIFMNNIIWYFISMFFFSRVFFVIANFSSAKYIESASQFFVTYDYQFSLFGAIFGFILVFFINLKLRREKLVKYVDALVLSFLLILSIGYIGALFGGQVYGIPTNYGIEIIYSNKIATILSSTPMFPLAIIYALLFFIEFAVLYILSMYIKVKGFIGHIGLIIFALIILIFENFSGKHDIFNNLVFLNMNQILAICLMIFSFYRLYILSQISGKDTTVIIDHK